MFETIINNIKRQANSFFNRGINFYYLKANTNGELEWKIKVMLHQSKIVIDDNTIITEEDLKDPQTIKYVKSLNLI